MTKGERSVDALAAAWAAGNYHRARQLAAHGGGRGGPEQALARRLGVGRYGLGLGLMGLVLQAAAWVWVELG